jgi:hypothetical protein
MSSDLDKPFILSLFLSFHGHCAMSCKNMHGMIYLEECIFLHAGRKIMLMLALFLAVWAWPKGLFKKKTNLPRHQSNKVTCRSNANPLPLGLKF